MIHKIEKKGEFTLPWAFAEEIHVREGDMVEILLRKGEIIIKKLALSCVFCSSVDKLVQVGKQCICRSCIDRLYNTKDGDYLYPVQKELSPDLDFLQTDKKITGYDIFNDNG
jgi:bifunctional DNA-binding transcriptional regulator/antitoxin component of YhaV-PrlF toxin-antitoxin module